MSNYRQGAEFERQLANRLNTNGMIVTRAAGSGSATRLVPDIMAVGWKAVLMIECKTYRGDYEGHEVHFNDDDMREIRVRSGSYPKRSNEDRDVKTILAIKCSNGGVPQYCEPKESPVVTVKETRPLYELMKKYSNEQE